MARKKIKVPSLNEMKKNQKEPTIAEVATEIGISKEDVAYALDAIQNPMSLYEPCLLYTSRCV